MVLYFYLTLFSGTNVFAESASRIPPVTTAYTRLLLIEPNEADLKEYLNLEAGTDYQAWDTDLDWLAAYLNSYWKTQLAITTLADNGVLLGNDTGAIQALPLGTVGKVLRSDGTDPTWNYVQSATDIVNTSFVTSVSATSPITASAGLTPTISTSMATGSLIGRNTAGTGVMEVITDIPTAVTIGSGYIYRAGGTDVADADVADNITITAGSQIQSGTPTFTAVNLGGDTATTLTGSAGVLSVEGVGLRNVGLDIRNYAVGDGVTDDAVAFQTAIDAAQDANVPLLIPATAQGYYINATLYLDTTVDCQIIGVGKPLITYGASGGIQTTNVAYLTTDVTVDADRGSTTLTLASVAGVAVGDLIYCFSDAIVETVFNTSAREAGLVTDVTGLVVTVSEPLNYSYLVADAVSVYFRKTASVRIENLSFNITAGDTYSMYVLYHKNSVFRNLHFYDEDLNGGKSGINIQTSINTLFDNITMDGISLGIFASGGCRNVVVTNCRLYNGTGACRLLYTGGLSSDFVISNCQAYGGEVYNGHAALRVYLNNCTSIDPDAVFQFRDVDIHMTDCYWYTEAADAVWFSPSGGAEWVDNGIDITLPVILQGCTFDFGGTATFNDCGDVKISNCEFTGPVSILSKAQTATIDGCKFSSQLRTSCSSRDVRITNSRFMGDGSEAALFVTAAAQMFVSNCLFDNWTAVVTGDTATTVGEMRSFVNCYFKTITNFGVSWGSGAKPYRFLGNTFDTLGNDFDATALKHDGVYDRSGHNTYVSSSTYTVDPNGTGHHAQSHTVASHSDTGATGTELDTLTDDSMADALHRHSELSASDGTPNPAVNIDATGDMALGWGATAAATLFSMARGDGAGGEATLRMSTFDTLNNINSNLQFVKSSSATLGTNAETTTTEELGEISWYGIVTGLAQGANIKAIQDGAVGTKVPTNLIFETYSATAINTNQFVLHNDGWNAFGDDTPAALLDVGGGTATTIDGTDDLLVKDDAEIDGKLFVEETATVRGITKLGSDTDNVSVSAAGEMVILTADPAIVFNTKTATDTDFWIGVTEDADGVDDDKFQIGDGITKGTNPFVTVDTSGNVGIGTTGPGAPLHVVSSSYPVIRGTRTSSVTNAVLAGISVEHKTTGDMVNGFGAGFSFDLRDNAEVVNPVAGLYGIRDGADNSGAFHFLTYSVGTPSVKMILSPVGDLLLNTATVPTANGGGVLVIGNVDANSVTLGADTAGFYADNEAASAEMYVMDEADNATKISPHDPTTGEWIFYSKNVRTGRIIQVDMEALVKDYDKRFGTGFMYESTSLNKDVYKTQLKASVKNKDDEKAARIALRESERIAQEVQEAKEEAIQEAMQEKVEVAFEDAIIEVAEIESYQDGNDIETYYELDPNTMESVQKTKTVPIMKERPTGKMIKRLADGIEHNPDNGKFYRTKTRAEVEAIL